MRQTPPLAYSPGMAGIAVAKRQAMDPGEKSGANPASHAALANLRGYRTVAIP